MSDPIADLRETRPWRDIVATMEKQEPELWKMLYPRIYEDVSSFYSPKMASGYIAQMAAQLKRYGPGGGNSYRLMYSLLRPLVEKRMPYMFLAPRLVEAIKHTTFDDDIDWTTMKLPFEAGIFVMPKGALVHPTDGDCSFIVYGRTMAGKVDVLPGFRGAEVPSTRFAIIAMCNGVDNASVWYDSCLTTTHRPVLKLRNLFYTEPGEEAPSLPLHHALDAPLGAQDEAFLEELGVIVFGTLLALTAKPELLTPAQLVKRIPARKAESAKEFWTPNLIGKHYQVRSALPAKGTHASPRMHWRRGHFRNQPCGPGLSERKTKWLEPMLINAA